MIDLHCHMLPAVDDGAKTIQLGIEMAQQAYQEGIDHIFLTPHHMDSEYVNHKDAVQKAVVNFQDTLNDNNIPLELRAGQEVHINGDLLNQIDNGDILYADGNGKYIMLELPHSGVPEYTNDMIFELKVRGITPVIVHPERNHGIQNDPDKLYDLVEQGCLTQLTATSYVGGFGSKVQKFTDQIVNAGLGFTFSSDAHNLQGRRFRMDEAYQRLSKNKGDNYVKTYLDNAESIWNGEPVQIGNINHIQEHRSFLSKLKKVIGMGDY
jgi:protein-tyrosine phosphatase